MPIQYGLHLLVIIDLQAPVSLVAVACHDVLLREVARENAEFARPLFYFEQVVFIELA